jgi:hypothetical protein
MINGRLLFGGARSLHSSDLFHHDAFCVELPPNSGNIEFLGHILIFGRTKVQGINDHFPPASPSSHANLSANLSAKAWRRRKPGDGCELLIEVFFHFWLD